MTTVTIDAAELRAAFRAEADWLPCPVREAVARRLRRGAEWTHASYDNCPVTRAYGPPAGWEGDPEADARMGAAGVLDRQVHALTRPHTDDYSAPTRVVLA